MVLAFSASASPFAPALLKWFPSKLNNDKIKELSVNYSAIINRDRNLAKYNKTNFLNTL